MRWHSARRQRPTEKAGFLCKLFMETVNPKALRYSPDLLCNYPFLQRREIFSLVDDKGQSTPPCGLATPFRTLGCPSTTRVAGVSLHVHVKSDAKNLFLACGASARATLQNRERSPRLDRPACTEDARGERKRTQGDNWRRLIGLSWLANPEGALVLWSCIEPVRHS